MDRLLQGTILVTGATGFVGRHLSAALTSQQVQPIEESMGLIADLRGAWAQAMNLDSPAAA